MPKEIIRSADRFLPELAEGQAPSPDIADPDHNPPAVVVGWDREAGTVQIVTRLKLAEIWGGDGEVKMPPAHYGFYVDLDRRGINDLIRTLRRARDSAFGRDE